MILGLRSDRDIPGAHFFCRGSCAVQWVSAYRGIALLDVLRAHIALLGAEVDAHSISTCGIHDVGMRNSSRNQRRA